MIIDGLIDKIKLFKNPSAAGLDTDFSYLPDNMKARIKSLSGAAEAVFEFNANIIDHIYDIVPCVKVQVAYYEALGVSGMECFAKTLKYAKSKGMFTIADCKRNDISSTAKCYSDAYLGETVINGKNFKPFECDFLTVNAYLGSDGIKPFLENCKKFDKGVFVLVKTSNQSGAELQNKKIENGGLVYEQMAEYVNGWGVGLTGKYGYSSVGAVVGATHKTEAENIRKKYPKMFFLIPGYGAQGGKAEDIAVCFEKNLAGGIVNSSRGLLLAYKNENYKGTTYFKAARAAASDMQNELYQVIGNR